MEGNDAKRIAAKTEELGTETGRLFQAASAASAGTGAAQSGKAGEYISSELFLLAAVEDKGALGELLRAAGATEAALGQAVDQVRGGERIEDADAEDQRQALDKYTIDLTERAEQGKLDPVVGRDDEIRRTVQVLHRRTKNNPVLIGDPGVRPRSSRGPGPAPHCVGLMALSCALSTCTINCTCNELGARLWTQLPTLKREVSWRIQWRRCATTTHR